MWKWTASPENAPDTPTYIELTYRKGDICLLYTSEKSAGGAGRRRFVVVPDQSSSCMCDCR